MNWPIPWVPSSHAQSLTISHSDAVGVYFPSRLNVSIHIFWEGKKYDSISPQSPQTWQNGSLESGPDLVRPAPLPHSMLVCLQSLKIIHWVPTHDSTWVHTLAVLLKLGHTLGSPRAMCKHKFLGPGPRTTNSVGRRGGVPDSASLTSSQVMLMWPVHGHTWSSTVLEATYTVWE